jgi:menaquinone-dependent protoporphyrinogen oxidase
MAHHSEEMTRYLKRHAAQLEAVPTALFQVSMASAYQDDEHSHLAHGMLQELLDETGFAPDVVALFAGALVYTRYGWIKRRMMRSIEKRQGGDTDTSHDYDYTDWDAVEGFAQDVHAMAASAR